LYNFTLPFKKAQQMTDLDVQAWMNDIRFDPEDTITKGLVPSQVMYYIYVDETLIKGFKATETVNMGSAFTFRMTAATLNNQ